jgi:hypothetical protein
MAYHEFVNLVREENAKRLARELTEAQAHKSGTFGTIDKDGSRKDFDGTKEKKVDPKSGQSDIDFTWTDKDEKAPTGKNEFKRPKDTDIADKRTLEDDKIDRDVLSNPEDRYENMKVTSTVVKTIDQRNDEKKNSTKK